MGAGLVIDNRRHDGVNYFKSHIAGSRQFKTDHPTDITGMVALKETVLDQFWQRQNQENRRVSSDFKYQTFTPGPSEGID
jgi:hypothetical protein